MLAADGEEFNHRDAVSVAQSLADSQAARLATAISKVSATLPAPPDKIILSGHGEFLAEAALQSLGISVPTVSLSRELGPALSRSATAHALATLAREAAGA
jgi:uncharacterized hydantoinase/oxoprolinase family protein